MSEALTKSRSQAIAVKEELPDFLKAGDIRGTEHIGANDLQLPRLSLAQALSPQIEEGNAKFIEGLKSGDAFNDLTGQIYGRGPFDFTVIQANPPRGIEFIPREEGGGIKDFNVPLDDPRMQFGPNGEKPVATLFYDFIIMFIPSEEIIALSLKSSGLKTARRLNSLMKTRNVPSFAGRYTIKVESEKNARGTYWTFKVTNSAIVDEYSSKPGFVSKDVYDLGAGFYESFQGKNIVIEREPGSDDATSFDTDEM